VSGMSGYCFT